MFNKLKQFNDLRDQAKSLKDTLASEQVEVVSDGIKLVMDGNQKIIALTLPEELNKQELETRIPEIFDQALKKVQRLMMEKVQAGGFKFPGM